MPTLEEIDAQVAGNAGPGLTIWTDRPPPAPPDTAPPVASIKFRAARPDVNISAVDPRVVSRANELFDKMPEALRSQVVISSGTRTREQQEKAYARFQAGIGGLAARPGHSQHEDAGTGGRALDFNGTPKAALDWLRTNGPSVGIEFPFGDKGDPAHAQLVEARSGRGTATSTPVSAPIISPSNQEQLDKIDAGIVVAGSPDSQRTAIPSIWDDSDKTEFSIGRRLRETGALMREDAETAAAIGAGVLKGVVNVPLGVMQAAQTPDAIMRPIQDMYQQLSDQFEEVTGKRPVADYVGRLMGSTAAILVASRALGAATVQQVMPRVMTGAWEMLGQTGRITAIGAGMGGTAFYTEGAGKETRFGLEKFVPPRVIDTIGGGIFGGIGAIVLKGVNFAASRLARSGQAEKFLPEVEKTAGDITRNTERPLAEALAHYAKVEKTASSKYVKSLNSGRQFEGFPAGVGAAETGAAEGFEQAIARAVAASPSRGIANRTRTTTLATRVENELGLTRERGRFAEWQAQQRQYEAEVAKSGVAGLPGFRVQLTPEQMRAAGVNMPVPPAPFVPEPVSAEAYAAARTAINYAIRGTRDPAAKTQAQIMLREIDAVAAEAAKDFGMTGEKFLRQAIAANRYYQENVAPLRSLFDRATSKEAAGVPGVPFSGVTPAQFFDKVTKMVEKGDLVVARDLGKVLGPQGKDNIKMMMMARALEQIDNPKEIKGALQYITKHETVLREMLGRDEYTQLVGLGKIAQDVMSKFMTRSEKGSYNPWARSMAPILATYDLAHGNVGHAVGTMVALPAYHAAMRVIHNIHNTRNMTPFVKRAASMDPESQAFQEFMRVIERRVQVGTAAAGRALQP